MMKQEKGSVHQTVRVTIDIDVAFSAMHDKEGIREMVERGARNVFPANRKEFRQLSYSVDNVQEHIFEPLEEPKG
jgi:hypothetical protein